MSPESSAPAESWPVLSTTERRILGVLVEKAKTTPDVYPLSLNSLVTGCNQKSNRDPMMNLEDYQVEDDLVAMQKKGLVMKITGSRVDRWRHMLYEVWHVDKVELAILGELLLRGPQTEGELRGRASRMEPIEDLDVLRTVLKRLTQRRLTVYLTPEGRRGTVVTHGFHAPDELERLRARHSAQAAEFDEPEPPTAAARPRPAPVAPVDDTRLDSMEQGLAAMQSEVKDLRESLARLTEQVRTIKEGLGI